MKYQIAKSRPLGGELRRIAAAEISRTRRPFLRKGPPGLATEAVHKARRHLKKLRSLLRLAKSGLGPKEFNRQNLLFRDIGREIRAARDAIALIEALDSLISLASPIRQSFPAPPPPIVPRLRRLLVRDARKIGRALTSSGALARTSQLLKEELKQVKSWKLKHFSPKQARRAWLRARKSFRRAFETAQAAQTGENLHEWRKRAKDLWHATLLLRKRFPGLQKTRHELKRLTDILGEAHDLSLLAAAATSRKETLGSPDQLKTLLGELSSRKNDLRSAAFTLAECCL